MWDIACIEGLFRDGGVSSLVLLNSAEPSCVAEYYVRDDAGSFREDCRFDVLIGKNGFGKKREGDLKTPLGEFRALTAFGIKPDPGTMLPYIDVNENIVACDSNCRYYNRIVNLAELGDSAEAVSGENMAELIPEYNYGIALDYNPECVYPLGSAIFFHCKGLKSWTGGCIAADEDIVRHILQTCGPDLRFVII